MKLRIRSLDSKETIRIEAPQPCTLGLLKVLIGDLVGASPDSLRLSLNRRDELLATSPDDMLQSLGLASGDLIFYSTSSFSAHNRGEVGAALIPLNSLVDGEKSISPVGDDTEALKSSQKSITTAGEASGKKLDPMDTDSLVSMTVREQEDSGGMQRNQDAMDLKSDEEEGCFSPKASCFSIPGYLRRVLDAEHGASLSKLGLLATAVHAVFLETGYLVQGTGDTSRLPEGWVSQVPTLSISYTVPELLVAATGSSDGGTKDSVMLKFCLFGKFVKIYGSIPRSPSKYCVCLNESRFVPAVAATLGDISSKDEEEVFQLWKMVKDGLALRLLIDICERNGLAPPPCFTRLPTDLKIMVIELLPGADLARLACVSSELKFLSSSDELWRRKFEEEFGKTEDMGVSWKRWKARFSSSWERRKRLKETRQQRQETYVPFLPFQRPQPLPVPFPAPRFPIIGGDYDLFPNIGGFGSGSARHIQRSMGRRNFSPNCNLSGLNM